MDFPLVYGADRVHESAMKLLIVDDHPLLREGLAAFLGQLETDTVVLQAGDAGQALALAAQHFDLAMVVLDLMIPGLDGLSAIAEFGRIRPELPVIVLSSSEDPRDARKALAQGALGYVPKSANPNTLLSAIRLVLNGDLYLPPLLLNEPAGEHNYQRSGISAAEGILTGRQLDVLRRLSDGQSNGAIALDLGLSEKTVKAHVTAIFKALNVLYGEKLADEWVCEQLPAPK